MRQTRAITTLLACACLGALPVCAADLVKPVADMSEATLLHLEGSAAVVAEGPQGARVLRGDGAFNGRIDMAGMGFEAKDFDLLKVEVKADAHANLKFTLENYPDADQVSHWYVLDSTREAFEWKTIWLDLRRPEEIMGADAYKGMGGKDATKRGLAFSGNVPDLGLAAQPPGRNIWLGRIRFARCAVRLDWDQRQAPYEWGSGQDLIFTYPLQVTNALETPVRAALSLVPLQAGSAAASLSESVVALEPRQTKTVQARITLGAAIASKKEPLYCEFFEARASAEGLADSEVTILRSSDPIHLPVVVPVPEEKLAYPFLPRRKDLPRTLTGFDPVSPRSTPAATADAAKPEDLELALGPPEQGHPGHPEFNKRGFYPWKDGEPKNASLRFADGLTACAFLYDAAGDRKYLDKGTALLARAADLFGAYQAAWAARPCDTISNGVFSINALRIGWTTGSMRSPYVMQRHGMFNDFDLLAQDMDPAQRERIVKEFMVPAAIQMRNHHFGLTNQQDVVNYPVLYAGLAARNWPLVAFAYASPHGVKNQIAWNFGDDGLAGESHYHPASVRPVLYATELLYFRGINLYDAKLYNIIFSPGAEAIAAPYRDPLAGYLRDNRYKDLPKTAREGDGMHLDTGLTVLRWKGLDVTMNWAFQLHRNAPDRCAFSLRSSARGKNNPIQDIGGGNYTHQSLGQSIIIVDEGTQNAVPAKVLSVDIDGAVQHVMASSDQHFSGSTITRTFALVDTCALVFDRVTCAQPRLVDWCLRFGDSQDPAPSVTLEEKAGGINDKPRDTKHGSDFGANLVGKKHFIGKTDSAWTEGNGRMTMLGEPGTEILKLRVAAAFSASQKAKESGIPVLMARRRGVTQTDFAASFAAEAQTLERLPVIKGDGSPAQAMGVKVTLKSGMVFHALVNYEPEGTEVALGELKTKERFATDCKADAGKGGSK